MSVANAPSTVAAEFQRQRLLNGPIWPTLFSIAWPTMVQMLAYSSVLLLETWFLGKLSVAALAGASLVAPVFIAMQAMASGGMGSAVSSLIAKAAGRGDKEQVRSIAVHALLIVFTCGLAFHTLMYFCGPRIYALLGGKDAALAAGLEYSNILFLGAPLMWLVVTLASILRGLGVVKVQVVITVTAAIIWLPLSPILIFGIGSFAGLGIRGAAIAFICYYLIVTLAYAVYFCSSKSVLRLSLRDTALSRKNFSSIFILGGISSLLAVQPSITALIITGLTGSFGTTALAGFGAATRLQQIMEPFIFSIGTATLVMVATCIGANNIPRARSVVLATAVAATSLTGVVGGFVSLFPTVWMQLFSQSTEVVSAGALYLKITGPVFWSLGLGMIFYFCAQAMNSMLWPALGSLLMLSVAAATGIFYLPTEHANAATLYRILTLGTAGSALITALGVVLSQRKYFGVAKVEAIA